jgi:CDP-paratose 2-epimerase
LKQINGSRGPAISNFSGGMKSALSLRQLSRWCEERFGPHRIGNDPRHRPFDVPWLVLDPSLAQSRWKWRPSTSVETILDEIARHAEAHPDWLDISR